ncbi:MAG TPA: ABC transporter substrate-binding protein [Aquabacterium sp.]|nr:ABC transporter substrate-binding protein [Aquabacterium sp.]
MTQPLNLKKVAATLMTTAVAWSLSLPVGAAESLKIGMVLPMSGPYAFYGKQIEHGARLYLQQHDGMVAGRKVDLVIKDDSGVTPETSKRAAQELVSKDRVDLLAGFALTPAALGAASVSAETHKAMVVMNAAASDVTTKSPYIVRVSRTLSQVTAPMAIWAARNKIQRVFILVADYTPGHDAATEFRKTFSMLGGEIVGEVRTPLTTRDFTNTLQRIQDAKPQAIFLFMPPGEQTTAFAKGFDDKGLRKAGVRIVATGDLTDEEQLDSMGEHALGITTSLHYSEAHDSPENKAFVQAYAKAYPKDRPNNMAVGGYDGMQLIARALAKTGGDTSGERFIAAVKGLSWTSPRGVVSIDPATRDIVQTVYIRRVESVNGRLQNVEFDKVTNVKDPGKR